MKTTTCATCGRSFPEYVCGQTEPRTPDARIFGTYADGRKDCEMCIAEHDRKQMVETGRAVLYLSFPRNPRIGRGMSRQAQLGLGYLDHNYGEVTVSNWPGSLKFKLYPRVKVGQHNMAGRRYDVWFPGPDGFVWHGTQFGDMTQICHCKRTKERI